MIIYSTKCMDNKDIETIYYCPCGARIKEDDPRFILKHVCVESDGTRPSGYWKRIPKPQFTVYKSNYYIYKKLTKNLCVQTTEKF